MSNSDSWGYELDGPGRPETRDVERIRDAATGDQRYLSTSQKAMVAIALCDPALLDDGMTAAEAWRRIDADQLAAILAYHGKGK